MKQKAAHIRGKLIPRAYNCALKYLSIPHLHRGHDSQKMYLLIVH